ncbi:MAG: glycosyltransferase [uncultured bacterium]|nr:MAG: glycosyltransferase [uncultured bacterium]
MEISAHLVVKNEENFVWYSVMSVIDYVDKLLIWDTGSTDNTLNIIEKINNPKIILKKLSPINFDEGKIRQLMLDATKSDWFIVLDADEIWWDGSIQLVTETIRNEGHQLESIVVPTVNMIGDMFHFQGNDAGRYELAGKVGHFGLRAINRKIPGLHGQGEHGVFMWADQNQTKIESRDQKKIKFLDASYIHTTHLKRSDTLEGEKEVYKRAKKLKYEIGIEVPKDFYYPEVFFRTRPDFIKSPWETPDPKYKFIASIETPLKKFRRRYLMKGVKHGY